MSKGFFDRSGELQVFSLNQKAFTTKRNGKSHSNYHKELIEVFHELDYCDKVVMNDPNDVVVYRQSIEQLKVHILLVELDGEFEQICREILCKETTLNLEECYVIIHCEAVRGVTLKGEVESFDTLVMIT